MRTIGQGGGRKLVIPLICMTVGAMALSGLFPFSGFFSKEAILGVLAAHSNPIWLAAGLTGALMTAYYSFRLIFFILFPKGGIVEHHHENAPGHEEHEVEHRGLTYWSMVIPVMILATVTLVIGFFQSSLEHFLIGAPAVAPATHGAEHGMGHVALLMTAIGCAVAGVIWAYFEFGRKGSARAGFLSYVPPIQQLFARRWFLDDLYRKVLDRLVYGGFTNLFTRNDRRIIDGAIDGVCFFTIAGGRLSSFLQSSMLQYNLLVMIGAVALVLLYFLF
jgi:NADH-quinone oxidoreductase subunit L